VTSTGMRKSNKPPRLFDLNSFSRQPHRPEQWPAHLRAFRIQMARLLRK
jgi:hypothetical protein